MFSPESPSLAPELLDRVLHRLELDRPATPGFDFLHELYTSWCQRVPFDNVRKMIHVRAQNPAPLPGGTAPEFFEAWLRHGTGGTCWSGAGALHALLSALGFEAERGFGTMLVAPSVPPNHGTVRVRLGGGHYLLDSSILHQEPLPLAEDFETAVRHPAWGVSCAQRDGLWHVQWRPLHKTEGFECRLEGFGVSADAYLERYEQTREWSPFNYQLCARLNRGNEVMGLAFGNSVTLKEDGSVMVTPVDDQERARILVEDFGMSEEIVSQLPADVPTPPPPGSATAAASS